MFSENLFEEREKGKHSPLVVVVVNLVFLLRKRVIQKSRTKLITYPTIMKNGVIRFELVKKTKRITIYAEMKQHAQNFKDTKVVMKI
jgi:hypothetical protein